MVKINTDHLIDPTSGWGYLPNCDEVHSVFAKAQEMFNPKQILEIGTHAGHSTTYMLELFPNSTVCGVGVSTAFRQHGQENLKKHYGDRVETKLMTSDLITRNTFGDRQFDLCLVDGNHNYRQACLDIQTCMKLDIKTMIIDNCEKYVEQAIKHTIGFKSRVYHSLYESDWNDLLTIQNIGLFHVDKWPEFNIQYNLFNKRWLPHDATKPNNI